MSFPSNFIPEDAIAGGVFVKGPSTPVEFKTIWQALSKPGRLTFTIHNETATFLTILIRIVESDGTHKDFSIEGNDTRAFTVNDPNKLQVQTQDIHVTGQYMIVHE